MFFISAFKEHTMNGLEIKSSSTFCYSVGVTALTQNVSANIFKVFLYTGHVSWSSVFWFLLLHLYFSGASIFEKFVTSKYISFMKN